MGKRKDTGKYAGDPEKAAFQVFPQEQDMSCGAACLRMLEQWVTGAHQGEAHWREAAAVKAKGIFKPGMRKALEQLPLDVKPLAATEIEDWREGRSVPRINGATVYLLFMDHYGRDGENLGHWILLLDLFPSIEKPRGREAQLLACYADSLSGKAEIWPWTSLLHAEVREGFRLTHTPH